MTATNQTLRLSELLLKLHPKAAYLPSSAYMRAQLSSVAVTDKRKRGSYPSHHPMAPVHGCLSHNDRANAFLLHHSVQDGSIVISVKWQVPGQHAVVSCILLICILDHVQLGVVVLTGLEK